LQIVLGRGVSEVSHKQLCCHTVMGLDGPARRALVNVPDLGFNHHRCKQHELDNLRLTSAPRVGIEATVP
jgi:hypothetical protein